MQDSCMVCAEHTIGSEIILDTPDGSPTWCGQVEARFSTFGDIVSLDARGGTWFASNVQQAQNKFWVHPMELLGDVSQVEAHFS